MTDEYVESVFETYALQNTYSIIEDTPISSCDRLALATVCKRPELRPLLNNVVFRLDHGLSCAFIVEDGNIVRISADILKQPVTAAFYLRHALEIIVIKSRLSVDDKELAMLVSAMAALYTATRYLDGMIRQEKEEVLVNLPSWMEEVVQSIIGHDESDDCMSVIRGIGENLERLTTFQGVTLTGISEDIIGKAYDMVCCMLPLAEPAERIITQGGDNRLVMDTESGLNQYGCSSRPRPWAITFSSCTSSSISDYAYQEVEKLRQDLITDAAKGNLVDRCEGELERVRSEIGSLMMLEQVPGTEVILTPSGTDGELYALYFALGNGEQGVRNIIVSSTEIGSGTVHAAGGRHFDDCTPLGGSVKQGVPIEGFATESVEVKCLELRNEAGILLSKSELDDVAKMLVEEALADRKKVLIHLLDCSKTGVGGPSIEVVQELKKRYQKSVEVVVDAAQMRLGRTALLRYIKSGFMVLMTGSKFFTGAPFSGALIVPPSVSKDIEKFEPLPLGLAAYGSKYDLPRRWKTLAKNLSSFPNLGLLLRWQSALWEMKAFFSVSLLEQFNTINTFGQAVIKMVEENPDIDIVMAPPHDRGYPTSELSWDQLPSIFTFLIYKIDPNSRVKKPLTYDEARFAYQCINMDISRFLPVQASDREHGLAAKRCHIGQPVRIHLDGGEWIGALRIAAGARLVSGVKYDSALGSRATERLDTEILTADVIFSKLSVIVKYWDDLVQYDLASGATLGAGFYLF